MKYINSFDKKNDKCYHPTLGENVLYHYYWDDGKKLMQDIRIEKVMNYIHGSWLINDINPNNKDSYYIPSELIISKATQEEIEDYLMKKETEKFNI